MSSFQAASATSPAFAKAEPSRFFAEADYQRFHSRAARHDRENSFFLEDFDDLKAAGYLLAAVPEEFGGHGLGIAALAREQRRLAYWAPATALATVMHLYWTGPAAALTRGGAQDPGWLLDALRDGAVLAARLFAAKEFAAATAREVVDTAVQIVGASALARSNELERLYRDVRGGSLQPPNADAVLDVIGRTSLGLLP